MAATPNVNAPQGRAYAVYNVPSRLISATAGFVSLPYAQRSQVTASNLRVSCVVKGEVSNPHLKAWTFTLDGHDFYVLRLGTTGKTLVYDLSTQTWSWWSSGSSVRWRANTGLNWYASGSVPGTNGSNVVVGDDSSGVLWVLNPLQGTDDPLTDGVGQTPFIRVATGQVPTEGREKPPMYQVYLTGSNGYPSLTANYIDLSYSDDQGYTYRSAGIKTVVTGDYEQEFAWRSLGLAGSRTRMGSLGRLIKITDNGAMARIDNLDVY